MAVKIVVPPATEPVALNLLRDHLRIVHDDEDHVLEQYLSAARMYAETTLCWRAFITQDLELVFDRWPGRYQQEVRLPRPPLQEVLSVKYKDRDNVEHTIHEDDYIVDVDSEPGRVIPVTSWPSGLAKANGIRIQYRAGYGDTPDDVPTEIRQGILILAGHFFEVREPVVIGTSVMVVPMTVESLLMPFRCWGGDVG